MRPLSTREHLLLFAALAIAAAMAVYVPRVRPARMRASALREQRERVEQQILDAKWPARRDDPERLAARRDALGAAVAAAREALRQAEGRFVSRGDPALADELRLGISALADRHRIRFRDNLSCPEGTLRTFVGEVPKERAAPDAARLVRFLTLGQPYAFRARQVTLETDFTGLRGFLRDLGRLEHRVLVLRFDITAGEDDRPGAPPLLATLVLVF